MPIGRRCCGPTTSSVATTSAWSCELETDALGEASAPQALTSRATAAPTPTLPHGRREIAVFIGLGRVRCTAAVAGSQPWLAAIAAPPKRGPAARGPPHRGP